MKKLKVEFDEDLVVVDVPGFGKVGIEVDEPFKYDTNEELERRVLDAGTGEDFTIVTRIGPGRWLVTEHRLFYGPSLVEVKAYLAESSEEVGRLLASVAYDAMKNLGIDNTLRELREVCGITDEPDKCVEAALDEIETLRAIEKECWECM